MTEKVEVDQNEMDPNSKEGIRNDSKRIDQDAQTEPGEKEQKNEEEVKIEVKKIFDYLSPSDKDPISFSPSFDENIIEEENDIYKTDTEDYKYAICILLKDNTNSNCLLLEETLKGIITRNLGGLSALQIEPKNIYITIFVNQTVEDEGNYHLVKKESLKTITEKNNFLRTKQTIKDENREINIDVICKKDYMTDIESLKCFYNYILYRLKKNDKPIISSIITAGVIPYDDSLKKLIQIAFHSNVKNQKNSKNYAIAVPALEVNDHKNLFIKLAQYDRAHFNIYNMSFYSETAAAPISSLLNTMIIDKILMKKLKEYYKIININSTIDYHDYNLALNLYRDKYKINYYCNEILGTIVYFNNFNYMDYKDLWVNKFSGYYGNFFEICKTFGTCNGLPFGQKIFMLFQIIGLLIEFIYPSLSILVIYSIFYEAFCIKDILPAVFMTMIYILMYLGSGACSMITNYSNKMQFSSLFFFIFMEVYYLFIIICSIPAMDNIKKKKVYKSDDGNNSSEEKVFNTAACACLIIFTFIIGILPIILKMKIISKNCMQMFIYLFIGASSSTSNFLIAKIWKAPETSGGEYPEERKGITIIFFFLFNLFIGFLSFYNYSRKLRSNCVMGLSIFYLIYLFFKVIGLLFPLLCGCQLITDKDNEIIERLSAEEENHSLSKNVNPLANSTDKLKKSTNTNENEEKLDNDDNNNNEENNDNKSEHNEENNDNENNDNYNENNNNENNNNDNDNENNDNDNNNNINNDNDNNENNDNDNNENNDNENNDNNNENNDNENNDNSRNINDENNDNENNDNSRNINNDDEM